MIFLIVSACMVLAAAVVLVLPLWRAQTVAGTGVVASNRQVHAARLEELEADLEAGRLSRDDYNAARRDLESDLAASLAEPRARAVRPQRLWASIAAVFLVVLAGGLYWGYGNWRVGIEGVQSASQQAVIDMVDKLARRLQTPEGRGDMQGWDMLGHSYMIMGRYSDALQAFEQARALSDDRDPTILASYAEALAIVHPDDFMDKAEPLFEKVLQMDPNDIQALWYGGLGALQRGDKQLAIQRWNAVLAQNPPADYRAYIEKAITDAGGTPAGAAPDTVISVRVSLAPALAGKVMPDDTVFIYAKPQGDDAGPPLVAKRLQVRDLPAELKLSDQDAVVPGRKISTYGSLTVTARVAKHGTPAPRSGDLEGRQRWNKADAKTLALVIDTVVK
ncbi:MAG TPA: c-type cytochrome biogenesis protein CcmI [Gammaproteobacteria bacterium]|nr:c-type cytochrome biogenesis protein CcmI [Gammaproteobacteria bacterium]